MLARVREAGAEKTRQFCKTGRFGSATTAGLVHRYVVGALPSETREKKVRGQVDMQDRLCLLVNLLHGCMCIRIFWGVVG